MNNRRHLFHLVYASPWPFFISFSAFFMVSGLGFYMHDVTYGGFFFLYGLLGVGFCAFNWCRDIVNEATFSGYHTKVVKSGLRLGFILFIISEIMLFFGFFWAFFYAALCPTPDIGGIFPPPGVSTISYSGLPLFNTFILISSGLSVTWAHRCICLGSFSNTIDALVITILLGMLFLFLQMYEYWEAAFNYSDGVYGCCFYMATGLHGMHVFVGVNFLAVCLFRLFMRHFTRGHYLGLIMAIWYWHFVDYVWIFLFLSMYLWGNW